jgi:hypothetical protein
MHGIQPTGAPEKVAQAVTAHIGAIQQQADAAAQQAVAKASAAANAIGNPLTPEAAGIVLRQAQQEARDAAKTQERALWQAVDPDGTMHVSVEATKGELAAIKKGMTPLSAKPTGEEASIYQAISKVGDAVSLKALTDLQSRVTTTMREEKAVRGESPAWRRLSMLNGAIHDDLESGIVTRVRQEQQAVAAGQMAPEDTAEYRLAQQRDQWLAARNARAAGENGGAGVSSNGTGGQTSVSSLRGAGSESGGGFGSAPGDPGLSPDALGTVGIDADAVARLAAARAATRNRATTFDNRTLAPILARPTKTGPYDIGAAAVPGHLFYAGPQSGDAIRAYQAAVGPQKALGLLEPYAIDRLRRAAMEPDGTLNPSKAASWVRSHADALRAFPALANRIRDALDASTNARNVAKAGQQAVSDAQQGALGRIMGMQDPADIARAVGGIFSRQDAVQQMGRLRTAIGNNKAAAEGLKKSITDYITGRFIGDTEVGVSGVNGIQKASLQSFLRQNRAALKAAGFNQTQMKVLDDLSDSLDMMNRSLAGAKIPGQSNTAQDIWAAKATDTPSTMLARIIGASAISGGGLGFLTHDPLLGAGATIATGALGVLRQNGINRVDDLVKRAMFDPQLALLLMAKATLKNETRLAESIGKRYAKAVGAGTAAALSVTPQPFGFAGPPKTRRPPVSGPLPAVGLR